MSYFAYTKLQKAKDEGKPQYLGALLGTSLAARFWPTTAITSFRTAVMSWGQTSQIASNFSPKRDCGPRRGEACPVAARQGIHCEPKKMSSNDTAVASVASILLRETIANRAKYCTKYQLSVTIAKHTYRFLCLPQVLFSIVPPNRAGMRAPTNNADTSTGDHS